MNCQPRQLALLISLIGAGVAPYAQAHVTDAAAAATPVAALPTLPGLQCNADEAAQLPDCGVAPPAELAWQPQRSALALDATPGVLVLYRAPRELFADATVSEDEAAALAPDAGVRALTDSAAPRRTARRAKAVDAAPVAVAADADASSAAPAADSADEHGAAAASDTPPEVSAPAPRRAARTARLAAAERQAARRAERASFEPVARLRVAEPAAPRIAVTIERGPQAERLYEQLIAVLSASAPEPVATTRVDLELPDLAAGPAKVDLELPDLVAPLHARVAPIEVETPVSKVLRDLDAVALRRLDGPPAFEPVALVSGTHAERVLQTLQGVAAPTLAVEDGPSKRLRKLAQRVEKATVQARADLARGIVDLPLPLTSPVAEAARQALPEPAPTASARRNPFGDRQVAVADESLSGVRGGFAGDGLNISFGIERAVYVNGALVTSTSMNVTELGQASAGRAASAGIDPNTVSLIQNGAGNTVSNGTFSSSQVGTVIQNTLDGQKIQNVTVINATANSLGVFRGLNLGSSLRGAVIDSLRR